MGRFVAHVEDHLILPARVSLPEGEVVSRRREGRAVAAPVGLRLVVDTGSKRTTLIPGIIRHLDPQGGTLVRVENPLSVGTAFLYWVRLDFPDAGLAPFDNVQVARLAMPPMLSQFHGLLGRDLLRRLESFDYQGRHGRYVVRDTPGLLGWLRRRL
jgi:hypothetical protein